MPTRREFMKMVAAGTAGLAQVAYAPSARGLAPRRHGSRSAVTSVVQSAICSYGGMVGAESLTILAGGDVVFRGHFRPCCLI